MLRNICNEFVVLAIRSGDMTQEVLEEYLTASLLDPRRVRLSQKPGKPLRCFGIACSRRKKSSRHCSRLLLCKTKLFSQAFNLLLAVVEFHLMRSLQLLAFGYCRCSSFVAVKQAHRSLRCSTVVTEFVSLVPDEVIRTLVTLSKTRAFFAFLSWEPKTEVETCAVWDSDEAASLSFD